tara:strand:- start:1075 stop:1296 length:222 start_codon:yes stop_codon:yes gene_type:complete
VLASKPLAKKLYFSKRNTGLNMNKKIVCNFLFISFSAGQLVDYKSSYKNLTNAVEFAYQNNLNVLIEDFTGVG